MKRMRILQYVLIIFIVIEAVVIGRGLLVPARLSDADEATRLVRLCSETVDPQGCYDDEIPGLMSSRTMEETFAVTRIVQQQDPSYAYCHELGHELSAIETRKDPDRWQDVVARCPTGECSNGCIHGAFQERFRVERLEGNDLDQAMAEFAGACRPRDGWNPTSLEQASCFHAFGHLLMYVTDADSHKSVDMCRRLVENKEENEYRKMCYDGVFMQIFQPLAPEDFALIAGKEVGRQDHESFCASHNADEYTSCWTEGWPLYMEELQDPDGLISFCDRADERFQIQCHDALMYVITVLQKFDLNALATYCQGLSDGWQGRCFANVASRLIETDLSNADKAIAWCHEVVSEDTDQECFRELAKLAPFFFHSGSEEQIEFCESMPQMWREDCLQPYVR